jgi:uncharacterized protein YbaR (Trm112 family)
MHASLLEILRCTYCGSPLEVVENDALVRGGDASDEVEWGVLGCECCAYPVLDGIPILIAADATRHAMHTLEAGRPEDALVAVLGRSGSGASPERLRALVRGKVATYQGALALLCGDAEGTWFLHHFSDPTYVAAEALLRAIAQDGWPVRGRTLDLCGGAGHLARVLHTLSERDGGGTHTVLADLYYWKLWLARRYSAREVASVCCDANHPLPFTEDTFSLVLLLDAFPYIWHKRLVADEMTRLAGDGGVIVMPHLHSATGENFSAGDTLTPAAYQRLFARLGARLFSDRRTLDDVLERRVVDLSHDVTPEELGDEASLTLIATRRSDLYRRYELPARARGVDGEIAVNPLYRVERRGGSSILTLEFPTPEYEAEFGDCRRYMPERVTVEADLTGRITPERVGPSYDELRERRVLIDAPVGYAPVRSA